MWSYIFLVRRPRKMVANLGGLVRRTMSSAA
jgi:hypothetical protein